VNGESTPAHMRVKLRPGLAGPSRLGA